MPSSLTWIDHDNAARERSYQLLHAFTQSDTRDELGIGSIRDAIADRLFPGTSVIQTRLRYMLLLPQLFMRMERDRIPAAKFKKVARERELALNDSLVKEDHAFGKSAGHQLQRLASSVYWAGLGSWGIRTWRGTQQEYFRHIDFIYTARARKRKKDDGDWLDPEQGYTWHPSLREIVAEDALESGSLRLCRDEAMFIREQWKRHHPHSLLTWLAFDPSSLRQDVRADMPWLHPRQHEFPPAMRALVDHGRRFSKLVEGAALLYNYLLSEFAGRKDSIAEYQDELRDWTHGALQVRLHDWNITDFWQHVQENGHAIAPSTQRFVSEWLHIVTETRGKVTDSTAARSLIERREQTIKRERSRFRHDNISKWGGRSGLVALSYRWNITSRFLIDLATGLEAA